MLYVVNLMQCALQQAKYRKTSRIFSGKIATATIRHKGLSTLAFNQNCASHISDNHRNVGQLHLRAKLKPVFCNSIVVNEYRGVTILQKYVYNMSIAPVMILSYSKANRQKGTELSYVTWT